MAKKLTAYEESIAQKVSESLLTIVEQARAEGLSVSFRKTNAHGGDLIIENKEKARGWTTCPTTINLATAFLAFSTVPGVQSYPVARRAEYIAAEALGLFKPK